MSSIFFLFVIGVTFLISSSSNFSCLKTDLIISWVILLFVFSVLANLLAKFKSESPNAISPSTLKSLITLNEDEPT